MQENNPKQKVNDIQEEPMNQAQNPQVRTRLELIEPNDKNYGFDGVLVGEHRQEWLITRNNQSKMIQSTLVLLLNWQRKNPIQSKSTAPLLLRKPMSNQNL
jgi:hypothetical protein